jgi:hypothetical protein
LDCFYPIGYYLRVRRHRRTAGVTGSDRLCSSTHYQRNFEGPVWVEAV